MEKDGLVVLFKCLADSSRLEIIRALRQGPKYVEQLAEWLGLAASTVSFHLKKLEGAGLVTAHKEQYYTIFRLEDKLLKMSIDSLLPSGESEDQLQSHREETYRQKVLDGFMEYGKLKSIPVQRKKRLIVLAMLASHFAKESEYTEKEVNLLLADFHDDFCTLRRELVGEGFLERDSRTGVYRVAIGEQKGTKEVDNSKNKENSDES